VQANPVRGQVVLNVATLLNKSAGANPHFWYDPAAVASVVQRIASDLANIDSANAAAYIAAGNQLQTSGFAKFTQLVSSMQQRYAGVPVGATESIAVYLTGALHLSLITPPAFMQAIAEGHEPAAADTALFHQQLSRKEMRVLLFNTQGATPATTALKQAAQQAGIPVVDITETLSPPDATFQDWQVAQLTALDSALHQATGQ
jgi:zinc/manganese transport system substrate-binding protein